MWIFYVSSNNNKDFYTYKSFQIGFETKWKERVKKIIKKRHFCVFKKSSYKTDGIG